MWTNELAKYRRRKTLMWSILSLKLEMFHSYMTQDERKKDKKPPIGT